MTQCYYWSLSKSHDSCKVMWHVTWLIRRRSLADIELRFQTKFSRQSFGKRFPNFSPTVHRTKLEPRQTHIYMESFGVHGGLGGSSSVPPIWSPPWFNSSHVSPSRTHVEPRWTQVHKLEAIQCVGYCVECIVCTMCWILCWMYSVYNVLGTVLNV